MRIQSIMLLIISVMLVIMSSWNLSIFSNNEIDTEYKKYDNTGKVLSIIMLFISIILMFISGCIIYSTPNGF